MHSKISNYTCIFGGGAMRGMAYIGSVKALEELQIDPQTIAGSSVGAIFAGLLAVGYNSEEIKDIFMQTNFELFKDIHFGFGKDFAISKGEIFLEWLRDLIEKKYYGKKFKKGEHLAVTFKDLSKNLIIVTTDLTNFKYKEFSKFETPDYEIAHAIRISASMPGLMKPVIYNNAWLVDGDLLKSAPMWKLSKNLCPQGDRVLEFRLEGDFSRDGQNAIDFLNTVYSCVTSLATDFIIKDTGNNDKYDYIKINTGSVVIVDFGQSKQKRLDLMDVGYNQTLNYFKKELKEKKQKLIPMYKNLLKHVTQLENYIGANKIEKSKNQIGALFIELHDYKDLISNDFAQQIIDFKQKFFENLLEPTLFGKFKMKNHAKIKAEINQISNNLAKHISELEAYI